MSPISFSSVNARKLALKNTNSGYEKISFRTVNQNLTANNVLLFVESCFNNEDTHCKQSFFLYNDLLKKGIPDNAMKYKIESALQSNLIKVSDLDSVYKTVSSCDNLIDKDLFFNSLEELENCDRVIRNEAKLSKRFDLQKIINENIGYGCRHTVFELCSLLDTYSISPKAKMNIALENVSYALFKSGYNVNLNEVTEYIAEYFLTRDPIITDKDYNGYINVLETNAFIDKNIPNISYIFEAKNTKGNSYADKLEELISQTQSYDCKAQLSKVKKIKNEKQASEYIDETVQMIINNKYSKFESGLLLKSIYILPLIGNISKDFVNYKLEMSKNKVKIKQKVSDTQNKDFINSLLDDGDLIDAASYVSENMHFKNYILDDGYDVYTEESSLDTDVCLEGIIKQTIKDAINTKPEKDDSDAIKEIINSFKASNEKSPSKFKNMISRIMTKSPDNIINESPNIFKAVRIMMYIGLAVTPIPLAPVFSAVLALVNTLITKHLDLKQAEKLLRHLNSEKEKAEKKLEKLSDKEKDTYKEYIATLDKCINKTKNFISSIDDESEELYSNDDDFGFDFNWESAILESGTIINTVSDQLLGLITSDIDNEILTNLAEIFDNCSSTVSDAFYNKVKEIMNESVNNETINSTCKSILENRGNGRIISDEEPGYIAQYQANLAMKEILAEATNIKKKNKGNFLTTVKMATINFKKKLQDLNTKQKELWRNIDICTGRIVDGIQKALTSDRREAIIKGSIIPSFSKMIKYAITVGAVGAFTGPVGAAITAVGIFGSSKYLNHKERLLLYDEIDTELQVVEKQIQLAENDGDMNQYRFLLNYQKKLQREKYRIKYGVGMTGRTIPKIKGGN